MNEMISSHQRESDDSNDSYGESKEGNYEAYRNKNLPEGYTAYRETGQELVYDRYSSVYSRQSLKENKLRSLSRKLSCHQIGWLLNFDREMVTGIKKPQEKSLI